MPKVTNRIQVASRLTRDAIDRAIERAAESHVEVAQQLAPVDTGNMRDNIGIKRNGRELRVVSEAPYSVYVEFGTTNSEAQPFFMPAFESAMRQFRAEVSQLKSGE